MLTPVVCRIPVLHLFSFTLNYIGTSTTDFAVYHALLFEGVSVPIGRARGIVLAGSTQTMYIWLSSSVP